LASEILVERRDGGRVAVVTINRPHRRNACDLAAWRDMRDVFRGFAEDRTLRLAVLTGAQGHFCAGDDILAFREALSDPVRADAYRAVIQECFAAVQAAPVPVIAAMSGVCVGGDASARVSVPVARLGLVYPTIQLQRLSQLIGVSQTRRWLYTGEFVGADSARQAGFIDDIHDDPVAGALAFGAGMMDNAPLSIAGSKLQLNAISAGTLIEDAARIQALSDQANQSEDYRNAATAFAEKRQPVFVGR
jgi:enoyl-CoA hydratase/carnithine racemase